MYVCMYVCKRLRFFKSREQIEVRETVVRRTSEAIQSDRAGGQRQLLSFLLDAYMQIRVMSSRSLNNAWTFLESEPFSGVVCPNLSVCMSLCFFVVSVQNRFTLCLSK